MNKYLKIALWTLVVITLVAGGYLLYAYLSKPVIKTISTGGPSATSGLKELSSTPVFDYWTNKKTGDIYYIANDGSLFKIDAASGQTQSLESKATGALSFIKPSPDGSAIIAEFGYPQQPALAIYMLATKSWQALPPGAIAAAWDPQSSNRIAYMKNGTVNQLFYFTLNDKKSKLISSVAAKDVDLDWIVPDFLYLTQRPSNTVPGSMWSYNLRTGAIQTLAREETGLSIKWDTASKTGLRWSFNRLSIIDATNKTTANIDLKTLPSKCAFTSFKIYCAAPADQGGIASNDFPDGYLTRATSFVDDVSFVYLTANISNLRPLLYTHLDSDADRLEIQGNHLIFINRLDGKLYSLPL